MSLDACFSLRSSGRHIGVNAARIVRTGVMDDEAVARKEMAIATATTTAAAQPQRSAGGARVATEGAASTVVSGAT
jgi:hypothetical protein